MTDSADSTASSRQPAPTFLTQAVASDMSDPIDSSTAAGRRAATSEESRNRMEGMKRQQRQQRQQLLELRLVSRELSRYGRGRFEQASEREEDEEGDEDDEEQADAVRSKCLVSPFVTMTTGVGVESVGADVNCYRRARLMNELRLRQPLRPIRFRHDRTAQELTQEGQLLSRTLCLPYKWPQVYKYNPNPRPRLLAWAEAESKLAAERSRRQLEASSDSESADAAWTGSDSGGSGGHRHRVLIEECEPAPIVEQVAMQPTSLSLQERPRKASSGRRQGQQGQQQQQQQQQQQRSKSQSSLKRCHQSRQFSVSTIDEGVRAETLEEIERLNGVCDRICERRRQRREAAAAAKLEQQRQLEEEQQQKQQQKQQQEQQQQQQQEPPPPAPAPATEPKSGKPKRKKSASSTRSGSDTGSKKASKARAKSPKGRAKSPKGRAKSPKGRAKSPKPEVKEPQQPMTPVKEEPAAEEPPLKDAIDHLVDEIEAASVAYRLPPGPLPPFPCRDSEAKTRQHLTRLWWRQQSFASAGSPSLIG